jgi:fagellar hook-basal body proteins
MIRSLWTARTGLDAQQTHLDVISNNLANVSTNGFKRQRAIFEDLLYQTIRQPGAQSTQQTQISSGLQIGTGVKPVATERIFTQGTLQQTGGSLDVAVQGNGFFQISMPDGTTAYTRDGAFQLDSQGNVSPPAATRSPTTSTFPADALSVTIGKDGTVSVLQAGGVAPVEIGAVQLATFVNPGGLQAAGRTCSTRPPPAAWPRRPARHQWLGCAQPGLCRGLERQRRRRAGEHDRHPARLRAQLARHLHLRPDARSADPALRLAAMKFSAALALAALALLSGCASIYPTTPTAVHQPMTARPESRAQSLPATGSIYQAAYARPLFEDRRARNVGDTITINLVERNTAQKSANANATRNGNMSAGIGPISRLPLKGLNGLELEADSESDFAGKGAAAANNAFNGTITVTVIDVYPNGNLLVSGEKMVAINQGNEFIRFSG